MNVPDTSPCVVATAGHVDHGKSTLVRTLTGRDPDRLAEEKRRGLTIDLGFAEMRTGSGASIAFVDVPGHGRFISNMLAGVGPVDAAMLVVDTVEGWKPQSEEHLSILDLVGIQRGVVVLTKAAKADAERHERTRAEVSNRVAASRMAAAPIVTVDALTGFGMDDLRAALDKVAKASPPRRDGRARLWIDRAFVIEGAGTVITGTLTGGTLTTGDEVAVVTRNGLRKARVRRLKSFDRECTSFGPGHRVAINLAGLGHREISRGNAVVHPGRWHLTRMVDASVETLADAGGTIGRRGALHLYIGSAELPVRVRPLHGSSIMQGRRATARITLPTPLALAPGDRFVLRDVGRGETIGGGEVLDVDPQLPVSRAAPDASVDRVIREHGWLQQDELERLTGERRRPTAGRWIVDPDHLRQEEEALTQRIETAGTLGLDTAVLDYRERTVLGLLRGVVVEDGRARTEVAAAADRLDQHPFLAALAASPFRPPSPEELGVDPTDLGHLVRRGLVVQHDGITFAPEAVEQAAGLVAALLLGSPSGVTAGQARQAMDTTRKWAIPLLSLLDSRGVTVRRGDRRFAGPRCP